VFQIRCRKCMAEGTRYCAPVASIPTPAAVAVCVCIVQLEVLNTLEGNDPQSTRCAAAVNCVDAHSVRRGSMHVELAVVCE
jgi:hypothetical protein